MKTTEILRMLSKLNPVEILVLKGIISGDGDIGGRMASSHPDAEPPVSAERKEFLTNLANDFVKADMPFEYLNDIWGKNNAANPN